VDWGGGDLGPALRVGDKRPGAVGAAGEAVPDAVCAVAVGEAAAVDDFGGCVKHHVSDVLSLPLRVLGVIDGFGGGWSGEKTVWCFECVLDWVCWGM
jgi:hypothetical protein